MDAWRSKAHRLIAAMCLESYTQANRGRKRHRPYSVPVDAAVLVRCLDTDDEQAAKALFNRRAVFNTPDTVSLTY